jgi:hypothetical protein
MGCCHQRLVSTQTDQSKRDWRKQNNGIDWIINFVLIKKGASVEAPFLVL